MEKAVWKILEGIPDPEIPVISVVELGVVRSVQQEGENQLVIEITPTYSGCPALKAMEESIRQELNDAGYSVRIKLVYKPAWTTDWMSDQTRQKLREYGIAPPAHGASEWTNPLKPARTLSPACPYCNSNHTRMTSAFGSTACKALHFCDSCCQPFEHFKCH